MGVDYIRLKITMFEKTNLGWQVQQWQQEFAEWMELQWTQVQPRMPKIKPWWLDEVSFPWWLPKLLFWAIAGALAIWFGLWLLKLWERYYRFLPFPGNSLATPKTVGSGVAAGVWWRRGQEFYRQGKYREACRAFYLGMLQKLHEANLITHQASRTDGEYRQLTGNLPHSQSYQTLLNAHEQICFGAGDVSAAVAEQCQQAYQDITS